ncbi:MAG: hypothetical protein ACXWNX_05785, partial [Isosphaeraceae bacterium]
HSAVHGLLPAPPRARWHILVPETPPHDPISDIEALGRGTHATGLPKGWAVEERRDSSFSPFH